MISSVDTSQHGPVILRQDVRPPRLVMDVQDALDPVDRLNNVILSCQARCVDQVVVEA